MRGRLLRLWHALYGNGDRVAGRDKGKRGRLVLISIPRRRDVGVAKRVRGIQRGRRRLQAERCRG